VLIVDTNLFYQFDAGTSPSDDRKQCDENGATKPKREGIHGTGDFTYNPTCCPYI